MIWSNVLFFYLCFCLTSPSFHWPVSICFIPFSCGNLVLLSSCRLTRYKNFKEGLKRILVATDLVGRGIDIERVNIVVNYDMPDSADTYLHRVILLF